MTGRRGKQTNLRDGIDQLARALDRRSGGGFSSARVAAVWTGVVGPQIAAHTRDPFMRGSELIVPVDSPVWATELSAMSEQLRTRINEALGKELVRNVRFTVSSGVSRGRKDEDERDAVAAAGEANNVPSIALSESEMERVEASVAGIANPALREAALRATVRHLEWSKGIAAAKQSQTPREGL